MRIDDLKWHGYGGYTEMTSPSSNIFLTDEEESKYIIVQETLSQSCFANKDEWKQSIFKETLLQKYYPDVDKLFSTEEDK